MFKSKVFSSNFFRTSVTRLQSTQTNTSRSTVDQSELDQFKKHRGTWWDEKHGDFVPLHSMNNIRIPFIRTGLINTGKLKESDVNCSPCYLKGVKILDVGCGGGILSIPLARLGAEVTGIDPAKDLIEIATTEAKLRLPKDSKIEFIDTSIENHVTTNKEVYDAVVVSEVVEHVSLKDEFLEYCIQSLKPSGSLFITTLNRSTFSWLAAIVMGEYVLRLIPQGTHEWEKFITPEELKRTLENKGCMTVMVNGMFYIPYQNEWHWVPNNAMNYAVHAVKTGH